MRRSQRAGVSGAALRVVELEERLRFPPVEKTTTLRYGAVLVGLGLGPRGVRLRLADRQLLATLQGVQHGARDGEEGENDQDEDFHVVLLFYAPPVGRLSIYTILINLCQ